MVSHPLIFLGIMPRCVNPQFFVCLFKATVLWQICDNDAQRHSHLLLRGDRNLAEFIAIWKECTLFPSSQVSSTYLQNKNHIPSNSSLRYKWHTDSSIWIDWELFVSNFILPTAVEFVLLKYTISGTYIMKYTLWGVCQYNQIWDEEVVRHFLRLMSIGICILCRCYEEQPTAICYSATTVPQDQGYKRIISFSSLILSLVINRKPSRINFNWSVRFLNNWHSLQSLDKITTGVWGLAFSSSFF